MGIYGLTYSLYHPRGHLFHVDSVISHIRMRVCLGFCLVAPTKEMFSLLLVFPDFVYVIGLLINIVL